MIKSLLRWILAFVAATVAVVLVAPLAVTASLGTPGVAAYAYDSHGHSALAIDTATERGPPLAYGRHTTYGAVDTWSRGASARREGAIPAPTYAYDNPTSLANVASLATTAQGAAWSTAGAHSPLARNGVAANGGSKIPWTSWQNYPKVTQGGREYAQVGDRLYSHHAVDRLQSSGLGAPAGATGAGRSISPNFVEDVLGSTKGVPVKGPNGEARLSFTSGTVQVITENNIVITVITR
jgi:hypothetical protein